MAPPRPASHSLLTSVLFPTLGRPIIATVGLACLATPLQLLRGVGLCLFGVLRGEDARDDARRASVPVDGCIGARCCQQQQQQSNCHRVLRLLSRCSDAFDAVTLLINDEAGSRASDHQVQQQRRAASLGRKSQTQVMAIEREIRW